MALNDWEDPRQPGWNRDLYAELDVPRTASGDEIKEAYRKKARELHPDFKDNDKYIAILSKLVATYPSTSNAIAEFRSEVIDTYKKKHDNQEPSETEMNSQILNFVRKTQDKDGKRIWPKLDDIEIEVENEVGGPAAIITTAYEVLADEERRKSYNNWLETHSSQSPFATITSTGRYDPTKSTDPIVRFASSMYEGGRAADARNIWYRDQAIADRVAEKSRKRKEARERRKTESSATQPKDMLKEGQEDA